jgi:hypothetical protein
MKKILYYTIFLAFFIGCEKSEIVQEKLPYEKSALQNASVKEINVPEDFPTIQEAVNHASDGTSIYVSGTYTEYVIIENLANIKLIGKGAYVKQPNFDYYGTFFRFNNCKNFEFSGFNIDGDDSQMIAFDNTKGGYYRCILTVNSSGEIANNNFKNMVMHNKPGGGGDVINISNDDSERNIFILNNKITNFFLLGIGSWGNSFLKIDGNEIICSQSLKYNQSSCINPMGGSVIITNNSIYGCPNPEDVHVQWGDVVWGMVGVDLNDTRNVLVLKNNISNCNPAIFFGNWPQGYALESVKVLNNKFINNTTNFRFYQCTEDDIIWGKNIFN